MRVRVLLVISAALAAACGNTEAPGSTGNGGAQENSSYEPAAGSTTTVIADETTNLSGTKWILKKLEGRGPIEGTEITLNFRQGGLAGNAGCNHYNAAKAKLVAGAVEIPAISATEMACGKNEGGVMSQEQKYLRGLYEAASYRLVENRLEVRNGVGEKILLFEKEKA